MPITIRPSVVKIKKPSTGEYREINALLDTDSAKTVYYGVSSTAAATQTKAVTIEGISSLSDGLLVRILFTNAQSYSGVPELMINSTAASNIKTRRGTDATNLTWKAGDVLDFVYDSSSSGFIVLDKGDIKDLNGAINSIANVINVSQLSDLSISGSHFVQFTQHVNVGGIAFRQYSKGVLVATGTDATIYAIASDGNIYTAFRNGSTWANGRCISYEVYVKALQPVNAVTIPAQGANSGWISLTGLNENFVLDSWNFSTCSENRPPVDLSWQTGTGSNSGKFLITTIRGTPPTGETCRPVFIQPTQL